MLKEKAFWIVLILAVLLVFGVPFWQEYCLNDDCIYAKAAKDFAETGTYNMQEIGHPLFFHVLFGAVFVKVFGFSFAVLRFSTMLAAIAFTCFSYAFFRKNSFTEKNSALLSLLLLVNPLVFSLAHSFMTDILFGLLFLVSLYFFAEWLKQEEKQSELLKGCFFSFLAFLVRPFAVSLIASAVIAAFVFGKSRKEKILSLFFAVLMLAMYAFTSGVFSANTSFGFSFSIKNLARIFGIPMYFGFFLIGSIALLLDKRIMDKMQKKRLPAILLGLFLFFGIIAALLFFETHATMPYFGNILSKGGLGFLSLAGEKPSVFPNFVFVILTVLSALSIFVLVVGNNFLPKDKSTAIIALNVALLFVLMLFFNYFYDRYLVPMVAPVMLLLLKPLQDNKLFFVAVGSSVVFFAVFSFVLTLDYFGWQNAKELAVKELFAKGVGLSEIDAGHEYCVQNFFWSKTQNICGKKCSAKGYFVSFSPINGCKTIETKPYGFFGFELGKVFILEK